MNFIDFLLLSKQYKEAAEWCGKTALPSKDWEEKILIFAKEGKLEVLNLSVFEFQAEILSNYELAELRTSLKKFPPRIRL